MRLRCEGTRAETGSRGVRISGINAGYAMFRGSVKRIGYTFHSPVSPSLPLQCVYVCHHVSTGLYLGSSPEVKRPLLDLDHLPIIRTESIIANNCASNTSQWLYGIVWGEFCLLYGVYVGAFGSGAALQEVTGSIPDGVVCIFHWLNPCGHNIALGSTQHLTEMSTSGFSERVKVASAGAENLASYLCRFSRNSWSLTLLEL